MKIAVYSMRSDERPYFEQSQSGYSQSASLLAHNPYHE